MFQLYQLRYFLAVVETGSFTKAAERVYVTQPTLSAGIAKLEAGLETRLFDRTSRRVALTGAGSRLLDHAKSILHECSLAESELNEIETPVALRLGVLMTVPAALTSRLIRSFTAANPGVSIEIFDGTEQELANRLDQGQIDVAITVLRAKSQGTRLFEEPYLLAIAEHHPLARKKRVEIAEIATEPVIIRTRCEILSETSRFFTDHNARPPIAYRTDQDERALIMVAAGLGVTTMPASYRMAGMKHVELAGFDHRRTIGLIHARRGREDDDSRLGARFAAFAVGFDWNPA